MGREFKAVFFDLDGTLVDIHGPLYIAARNALGQLGLAPLTSERYHDALAHDDVWLGVPEHQRPEYMQLAFAYLVAELDRTERLEILPHVHETLAELRRRGYALAVITSRPGESRRLVEKLAMVGLSSYFDQVITQSSASLRALDKSESLRHAAARAAILPRACMYVGDEPRDVMAALNAGYGAAVGVATGPATYEYLRNHPQFRPDHVMHSISELVGLLDWLKRH
ncbi:MAG: HAD family hydrolase, partial [Candidatus Binataceae bacterium]